MIDPLGHYTMTVVTSTRIPPRDSVPKVDLYEVPVHNRMEH